MCTNCSFSQPLSGFLANRLMFSRYFIMNEGEDDGWTTCLIETPIKVGFGVAFAALFVVNVVETIARFFFALLTLPVGFFSKETYEKIAMRGMVNTFNSMTDLARFFFANIFESRVLTMDNKPGSIMVREASGNLKFYSPIDETETCIIQ